MILKTWWCSFTHILVLGMLLVTCLRDVPSGRRMPGGCQPHAYNLVWTCLKHQSGMGQNLSHTDPTLFGQTDTVTGFEYKYIHIYILIYIISLISFIITIYIYLCIYYKLQYIYIQTYAAVSRSTGSSSNSVRTWAPCVKLNGVPSSTSVRGLSDGEPWDGHGLSWLPGSGPRPMCWNPAIRALQTQTYHHQIYLQLIYIYM